MGTYITMSTLLMYRCRHLPVRYLGIEVDDAIEIAEKANI